MDKDLIKEKDDIETLRPQTLDEYVGQSDIKQVLSVYLKAAKKRSEVVDHILLYGPSGLGKTTLAEIIANETEANFKIATGGSIEKSGDLLALLTALNPGDVLFIDEIHRLPKALEEILYSAMEDYVINIILDRSGEKKALRIDLSPFTLIGATTMYGEISGPLRSRFGSIFKLNFYSDDEISQIIKRTARIFETKIDDNVVVELTKRSRATPRIANRLFLRLRDFADVLNNGHLTKEVAIKAFKLLKIEEDGLTSEDIEYLNVLINNFQGGPVGLDSLATALQEASVTLSDVYEPYLIKEGYIKYTPRGRIALEKAYKKINHKINRGFLNG